MLGGLLEDFQLHCLYVGIAFMLLCNDLVRKLLDFFFVALIREMFLLGCDYASIMCGDLCALATRKVSTWAVPATRPMETSFRAKSFYNHRF